MSTNRADIAGVDDADGVVARSPPKAFVKAELAELKGVVTQLEGALVENAAAQVRLRGELRGAGGGGAGGGGAGGGG